MEDDDDGDKDDGILDGQCKESNDSGKGCGSGCGENGIEKGSESNEWEIARKIQALKKIVEEDLEQMRPLLPGWFAMCEVATKRLYYCLASTYQDDHMDASIIAPN